MARKKVRDLSKTISKAVEHSSEVQQNIVAEEVEAPIIEHNEVEASIATSQPEPSQAKAETVIVPTMTKVEKSIPKTATVATKKKKKKVAKEMGRPAMEEPRYRFSATLTDMNKKYLKFLANKDNCKISDIINRTFADMMDKDKRVDRKFLENNY